MAKVMSWAVQVGQGAFSPAILGVAVLGMALGGCYESASCARTYTCQDREGKAGQAGNAGVATGGNGGSAGALLGGTAGSPNTGSNSGGTQPTGGIPGAGQGGTQPTGGKPNTGGSSGNTGGNTGGTPSQGGVPGAGRGGTGPQGGSSGGIQPTGGKSGTAGTELGGRPGSTGGAGQTAGRGGNSPVGGAPPSTGGTAPTTGGVPPAGGAGSGGNPGGVTSAVDSGRLVAARNANGTLIVFHVGAAHDILFTQQTSPSGGWTAWKRLTNSNMPILGRSLAVTQNSDGRLELFLVGTGNSASANGGDLLRTSQITAGGDWYPWVSVLGQNSVLSPGNGNVTAAARNADGTLVVFAIKPDYGVYYSKQVTPGGVWSSWQRISNAALPITGTSLAVGQNSDGRLELFLVGTGKDVLRTHQVTPSGNWAEWSSLRGQDATAAPHAGTSITVGRNADGALVVFALGTNGEVFTCRQLSPGGAWSSWTRITNAAMSVTGTSLEVGTNNDGRLELLLLGTGKDILQSWQSTPNGSWAEWSFARGRDSSVEIAITTNQNGTLEMFDTGFQGEVMHRWQLSAGGGWSPWTSLK